MTAPVSGTTATSHTMPTSSVDRPDQMGKDTFLKLLVAQMRYQDPSKPVDSSQMMSQTAVFSQVEKLEQIATQNASMLALQRANSAGSFVGRSITYTDSTGSRTSGVVTSVRLGSGTDEAVAMIGKIAVPLGRITEVAAVTPGPATTTATAPTTTPSTVTTSTGTPDAATPAGGASTAGPVTAGPAPTPDSD
ncbi:flagellar hook capping protein [Geodermatophilus sabuli]|uniref:Flagellar hook capping protein n=1 Tax=Geodermatophilus sabuli TaxID=1564158 RepID=A0A7K3VYV6_9ACTN|nr:flagellar hook capping FlgD N-terminal domain-containing protein [Geodermatophilus sabuli]NEK57825.1 flagellar hook capping protein [Geodermatophilus sabuli]